MIAAVNICVELGTVTETEADEVLGVFKMYGFPDSVSGISIDDVIAVSKNDKKNPKGAVDAVVIEDKTEDKKKKKKKGSK